MALPKTKSHWQGNSIRVDELLDLLPPLLSHHETLKSGLVDAPLSLLLFLS
jgi:hypothetical protein